MGTARGATFFATAVRVSLLTATAAVGASGIAFAQPDLHVSQFQLSPQTPVKGQAVTVSVSVYNRGTQPCGAFRVQWWASELYPAPAKTWDVSGVQAGGGQVLTFTYPGYPSHYVQLNTKVVVDSAGQIAESDEQNNVHRVQISVAQSSSPSGGEPAPRERETEPRQRVFRDVHIDAACTWGPAVVHHQGQIHMVFAAANRSQELLHFVSPDGTTWTRKPDLHEAAGGPPDIASFGGRLVCVFPANNVHCTVLLSVWNDETNRWTQNRATRAWAHWYTRNRHSDYARDFPGDEPGGVELFLRTAGPRLCVYFNNGRNWPPNFKKICIQDVSDMVTQQAPYASEPTLAGDGALSGTAAITRHKDRYHVVFPARNEGHALIHWTSTDGLSWTHKSELNEASQFNSTHGLASYRDRLVCVFSARNNRRDLLLSLYDDEQNAWTHNEPLDRAGQSAKLLVHGGRLKMYYTAMGDSQIKIADLSARIPGDPGRRTRSRGSRPRSQMEAP